MYGERDIVFSLIEGFEHSKEEVLKRKMRKESKLVNDDVYDNWKKMYKKLRELPKPSETFDCNWLYVERPKEFPYPKETKDSGKLLLFYSIDKMYKHKYSDNYEHKLDLMWKRIRYATLYGYLGSRSKVRTAIKTKYGKSKVICVYFYDVNDKKDIRRIKKCLRKDLSIKQKPKIKLNKDTLEGRYYTNKKVV